jgi:CBS domain-containing protein
MVRAKDIMTMDVISVKKETSVFEAGEILLKNSITGMPVVEDNMTLAGVITEKDILRLFYADKDEKNQTVKDYMTRPAIYYKEEDTLKSICDFMLINYFRRIPVTSKEGKVTGIISRPDILKYILQMKRT